MLLPKAFVRPLSTTLVVVLEVPMIPTLPCRYPRRVSNTCFKNSTDSRSLCRTIPMLPFGFGLTTKRHSTCGCAWQRLFRDQLPTRVDCFCLISIFLPIIRTFHPKFPSLRRVVVPSGLDLICMRTARSV